MGGIFLLLIPLRHRRAKRPSVFPTLFQEAAGLTKAVVFFVPRRNPMSDGRLGEGPNCPFRENRLLCLLAFWRSRPERFFVPERINNRCSSILQMWTEQGLPYCTSCRKGVQHLR